MPRRPAASATRSLPSTVTPHGLPVDHDTAPTAQRLDGLGRSLATLPSRRAALRLFTSAAIAALVTSQPTGEAEAHNPLKKCKKLKQRPARKRCIKRAKAHNAKHKKRKPSASCLSSAGTALAFEDGWLAAQTFTEPNGGKLKTAKFMFSRGGGQNGAYHLAVNTVNPNTGVPHHNTIASSAPVLATSVTETPGLVTFQFPIPPTLVAKRKYALVLFRSGSSGGYNVYPLSPGTCRGGSFFLSTTLAEAFVSLTNPPQSLSYATVVTR